MLFGAGSHENHRNGSSQNLEVQPEGPIVDILEIQPDPILEIRDVIASAHLPEAGQPGFDAQPSTMGQVMETLHFVDRQRTRPDEAHFAPQDVYKLWELINTVLT